MSVSSSLLVPGTYVGISSIRSQTGALPLRSVIIGQKLSGGTANAEELTQFFSKEDAETKFGVGSQLAEMADYWFRNNKVTEVFAIALDDAGSATKGTQTITFTGPATASGTIYLYINNRLFELGVSSGDSATDIGVALDALLDQYPELPVTATNAVGVVTLTAKNGGTVGNEIDVRLNKDEGQTFPTGVGATVATGVTGATDPDVADAISAIPDEVFGIFVSPYNDATNTGKLVTEMERRYSKTVELEGHIFQCIKGTTSAVIDFADNENSPNQTVFDGGENNATPHYLTVSAVAGVSALELEIDPARPLKTLPVVGVDAEPATNRRKLNEQQSLLLNGASTYNVDAGGTVTIGRMVTTNLTNSGGSPTQAYKSINTPFTASYLRQDIKGLVAQKFPRHKLADNGNSFGSGQPVVTPNIFKSEMVARFGLWQELALVENASQFASDIVVERDGSNSNKLNAVLPPDFVNQFQIADIDIEFIA